MQPQAAYGVNQWSRWHLYIHCGRGGYDDRVVSEDALEAVPHCRNYAAREQACDNVPVIFIHSFIHSFLHSLQAFRSVDQVRCSRHSLAALQPALSCDILHHVYESQCQSYKSRTQNPLHQMQTSASLLLSGLMCMPSRLSCKLCDAHGPISADRNCQSFLAVHYSMTGKQPATVRWAGSC